MNKEVLINEYKELQNEFFNLVDKIYTNDKDVNWARNLGSNLVKFDNMIADLDTRLRELHRLGYIKDEVVFEVVG